MSSIAAQAIAPKIPNFQDGLLPIGDYTVTLDELRASVLVHGCGETKKNWDIDWRAKLVDNFEIMLNHLWQVGIDKVFVDGSFAEDKDHPNDIDGYFECELSRLISGELQRELNLLEASKIWTWDPTTRRAFRGYTKKQLPMWHKYRVELYPHTNPPLLTGILDKNGYQLQFPAAFRSRRSDDQAKGIIRILK